MAVQGYLTQEEAEPQTSKEPQGKSTVQYGLMNTEQETTVAGKQQWLANA